VLQVCVNGARRPGEHPALPVTPEALAVAAGAAVEAGAEDVHLHPKDAYGRDSLDPEHVDAAVAAVRAAVPGITVGVTTGAWVGERLEHIRMWTVLPDHASVNWHEAGAEDVAEALLARGIAVHAGIWSGTDAARTFLASRLRHKVQRVLAEVMHLEKTEDLLKELAGVDNVLLHGEGEATWPVLRLARARGLDTRIGLEDTLVLPDGSPARDNVDLVRAAIRALKDGVA